MSFAFVHLSDIHFGQERGGDVVIHQDAKDRLIDDIKIVIATLPNKKATGVIITGDIAYGGKAEEYKIAAEWLDKVAAAAKCDITDIQVVPGNHDIDRAEISASGKWMLSEIATKGEAALDEFLANERDRSTLYARFTSYIPFAEGYNCSMDCSGGLASERLVELAPGRTLQFVGLNSALICKMKDSVGELLLGKRQRVLPIKPGRELVVLCHHPLPWLQDSADARLFVQNRARVFISGHEHKPGVRVEKIEDGCDLMTLEAGATVPPAAEGPYTYTYNVIEFEWNEACDGLGVTVHPRAWQDDKKRFDDDPIRLGDKAPSFTLGCPNFRSAAAERVAAVSVPEMAAATSTPEPASPETDRPSNAGGGAMVPDDYPLVLLRFFRDLTDAQRVAILVNLDALPSDWSETSSHALERKVLDSLVLAGRLDDVKNAIEQQKNHSAKGGDA